MASYLQRLRAIVDRHLRGEQALEPAAGEFVKVWGDWMRARATNRPTTLEELIADRPDPDLISTGEALGIDLSGYDSGELDAFLKVVNRKLLDGEGAA